MAEIILVKNRPKLDELLQTNRYKSVGSERHNRILEDFTGARAICTVDDDRRLEYIQDYLYTSCRKFLDNLTATFNIYWIEQNDLLDFNQFFMRPVIPFSEFEKRVSAICEEMSIEQPSLDSEELLWNQMKSHQKAKVIPNGYIRNYVRWKLSKGIQQTIDIAEMLHFAIKSRIKFGIPIST